MKKGKKWLLHEIRKLPCEVQRGHGKLKVVDILPLIDQLDEPRKVIIPQFVADEFDYNKNPYWEVDEARMVAHILRCAFSNEAKPSEFLDWVRDNPEDYVMAVRNGCEVEKEKLYRIILPKRVSKNWTYCFIDRDLEVQYTHVLSAVTTHTEEQIEAYDEIYQELAVEVAE